MPVLEIRPRLEQLGGEREAHRGEVGHAYESASGGVRDAFLESGRGERWGTRAHAYFRKMPSSVLNLELSSGAFSAPALEGVPARDGSLELSAELGVDPGRAFSAESWSAIWALSAAVLVGKSCKVVVVGCFGAVQ